MKSYEVLRWVMLLNVGVAVACGGTSTIGSGDEPGMSVGGSKTMGTAGTGEESTGATTSMGARPGNGTGGSVAGKPGMGGGGLPQTECMNDAECPGYDAPCEQCPDGESVSCNKISCVHGMCVNFDVASCPTKCSTAMDCAPLDKGCMDCGDGSQSCQTSQCVMGFCQTTFEGCASPDPCQGASCGAACKQPCVEGNCDMAEPSYCSAGGKCLPGAPECGEDCQTTMDCGAAPPNCVECGNNTCAAFECIANKCVFACPADPNPECKVSEDCKLGDICKMCTSGDCAVQACLQGSCQFVCPIQ
jgi:hypothetical protein